VICLDGLRPGHGDAQRQWRVTWTVITANATTDSGPIGSVMEATDEQTLWAASNDFDNARRLSLP